MECDFPNIRTENLELISMLQVSASKNLLDDHFTLVCASEFYYDLIGYTKED